MTDRHPLSFVEKVQNDLASDETAQEFIQRRDQFTDFMRWCLWVTLLTTVVTATVAIVEGVSQLYVVGLIALVFYPLAIVARRVARAGRLNVGVYMIVGALYVAFLILVLVSDGLLPVILLASILPVLQVGLFLSPRLVLRIALVTAGVDLILVVLERWLPVSPIDASVLVLFTGPPVVLLVGILAHQFGQTLSQALAASRSYTDELERSQAELIARSREVETTAADLAVRSQELEAASVALGEASRRQEAINRELWEANERTRRRAAQLQAVAEVSRVIAQVRDLEQLLPQVAELISQHFGYYHVGIFLVDQTRRHAVLRAANSEGGQRMLARNHKLAVGQGLVGYVVTADEPRIALDMGADAVYFDSPDLPDSRSEMALPLRVGGQTIGALDVQSVDIRAFDSEDVAVLSALADQVAIAIENARLLQQSQEALAEAEEVQRQYLQGAWREFLQQRPNLQFEYAVEGIPSALDVELPATRQAATQGKLVAVSEVVTDGDGDAIARAALSVPIKLRGQVIGVIDLHEMDETRTWTEHEVALAQAVADQMAQALESQRLFEQTQARARREQLVSQITTRITAAANVQDVLRVASEELGKALGVTRSVVRLRLQEASAQTRLSEKERSWVGTDNALDSARPSVRLGMEAGLTDEAES